MTSLRSALALIVGSLLCVATAQGWAQTPEPAEQAALTIEVSPTRLTLGVGDTASLVATVRDADGAVVDDATVVYFSRARRSVGVTREGEVEAYRPGDFTLVALVPKDPVDDSRRPDARVRVEVPVTVPLPPVERVAFIRVPPKFYVGTRPQVAVEVVDTIGDTRVDVTVSLTSSASRVAVVDRFGFLTLLQPGRVEITATAEAASDILSIEVEANPVSSLELQASVETARTGDVVRFTTIAKDARGLPVRSVPVQFGVGGQTAPDSSSRRAPRRRLPRTVDSSPSAPGPTRLSPARAATRRRAPCRSSGGTCVARSRWLDAGKCSTRHTSDLWIWAGADGRDYAITGTWGADGHSYIWGRDRPRQHREGAGGAGRRAQRE